MSQSPALDTNSVTTERTSGSIFSSASDDSSAESVSSQDEFNYKPVHTLAVICLVVGLLSFGAYVGVPLVGVCIIGIGIGLLAWFQIQASEGFYGGKIIAFVGIFLCTGNLFGSAGFHAWNYYHEVPEGYERISFTKEISEKKTIFRNGRHEFHPDVLALHEKKVFLKGYMYPTNQTEDLEGFILVKDNGQCCFGGQPQLTDMILVKMNGNKTVDYYQTRVAVAGTFKLGDITQGGNLSPIYILEADHFDQSRTPF